MCSSTRSQTMQRILFLAVGLALVALLAPAHAQESEDCLGCHSDADLTGSHNGEEISVFVDESAYGTSVHGDMTCVDCHADLAGDGFHDDEIEPEPVDCGMCHDGPVSEMEKGRHGRLRATDSQWAPDCGDCHGKHDIGLVAEKVPNCANCHRRQANEQQRSLHGQAAARGDEFAPLCGDCHGSHNILPSSDETSPIAVVNIPMLCGKCHQEGTEVTQTHEIHQDRILEHYSMSIHGEGLFQQGLTVTAVCTSCHTAHDILPHTDPASSIHRDNIASTCTQCHGQIERVHQKVIEGRLWEEEPHKIPACVDCHSPHKIRRVFYDAGMANEDCLTCHRNPDLTMERNGETISLAVDGDRFNTTAHATVACAQCHTDVTTSLERACETIENNVDCSICHAEPVADYELGMHGTLHAEDDPDAPYCLDCHGKHDIQLMTVPTSPTFPSNVPALCAQCHREGGQAEVRIETDLDNIVDSYVDSIHGRGLLHSGLLVTATCSDCHSAHRELPPDDERSTIHHDQVADTCAQCHHGIVETFRTSIHWPQEDGEELEEGRERPTCISCHTAHTISRHDLNDFRFTMMDQCGKCHEEEAHTFFDTFHGKVSNLGSAGAAKCYDCHGTHNILPTSNPSSALGRDNVVATCGECHEGSHRRFAGYLTHATHHDPDRYPWLFWSFWFMTILLVGTLTFAMLHTLAWLVRLYLSRDEWRAHKALAEIDHKPLFRRFTRFNRHLHFTMLISFFILSLTGMALKFSYMGWAQGFARLLGGFGVTGALHRMGAVILFVVFFLHIWYVLHNKKTKDMTWKDVLMGPTTILFTTRDAKEFVQSIKWFFGIGPRPQYGRYTYWEKFDYFAVLWGIMIIGGTGLLLWFPEFFTRILPGWSVNVATIIHSDEALLATGFIFTIHFFNTHFRPDKFPMDPVIFTGRMTVEELQYDKPGEYERLKASGELEEHIVEPIPSYLEKPVKVFGFTALFIGLTLIFLIIYTMLFGYR